LQFDFVFHFVSPPFQRYPFCLVKVSRHRANLSRSLECSETKVGKIRSRPVSEPIFPLLQHEQLVTTTRPTVIFFVRLTCANLVGLRENT
jgi:hypothetical protein